MLVLTDGNAWGGIQSMTNTLRAQLDASGWHTTQVSVRDRGRLRLLWMAVRADVLIASNNFYPAYLGLLLSFLSRTPLVVWVHGPLMEVLEHSHAHRWKRKFLKILYRHIQYLVFVSHQSKKSFFEMVPNAQCHVVIPNAVPINKAIYANRPNLHALRLVYTGRLSAEKRPHLLIDTLRLLPTTAQLVIVGDGPMQQEIRVYGHDLLTDGRLVMTGARTFSENLYEQFHFSLLTSHYEGCPMAALESLAVGIPCISVPTPAMKEIYGKTAPYLLASCGTAEALARTIRAVAIMSSEKIGKDIAIIAARHQLPQFTRRWLEFLNKC